MGEPDSLVEAATQDEVQQLVRADRRRIAYLLAVGNEDGGQQAVNQMFAPLSHMGFQFPPYASQFVNVSMKGKSEDGWQDEAAEFLKSEIRKQLRRMPK